MKICITCGMPLEGEHEKDFGIDAPEGPVCRFDSAGGKVKDVADIYAGGVQFFLEAVADGDRTLAERLTRKNMKALPYWQNHPSSMLDGEEASDEEFATAMAKL
jgi:hypothetical protein